ncbi:hypothetical protein MTO96_026519 [Rhipicephalus appendiculatus]|uniref:Lipocalin n=1 Tax=Rhipicephalus appendiculatus TaxID=34631 RepID=A0A131YCQ6_RHIAP
MASALMRFATSVLLLFLLAELPTSKSSQCKKARSLIDVDWSKLDKKLWIQALVDKAHTVKQCIARSYRGKEGKVRLRAVGGSASNVWNISKVYRDGVADKDTIRFPKSNRPHFYQILDTDYETYVVEHNCNPFRGNVVSLMYHKPVNDIPDEVVKKTSAAVVKSGINRLFNMTTTDCMLSGKGISKHIGPWWNISIEQEVYDA